nr:RNA-directed DNA polymerase, eukaryota, reverse transcriptase zinc-binding domain protein [Tanacetum cinerariifolium]
KACCDVIQEKALADCSLGLHHLWNSWIPRKVNICIWRASINRLATRSNLVIRGIDIPSTLCPFCELVEESVDIVLSLALVLYQSGERFGVGGNLIPRPCFPRSPLLTLLWGVLEYVVTVCLIKLPMEFFSALFGLLRSGVTRWLWPLWIRWLKLKVKTSSPLSSACPSFG